MLNGLEVQYVLLLCHTDVLGQLVDVVRPFCEVVMSEDTSGPITGLAIGALNKFLICNLISECVCVCVCARLFVCAKVHVHACLHARKGAAVKGFPLQWGGK